MINWKPSEEKMTVYDVLGVVAIWLVVWLILKAEQFY